MDILIVLVGFAIGLAICAPIWKEIYKNHKIGKKIKRLRVFLETAPGNTASERIYLDANNELDSIIQDLKQVPPSFHSYNDTRQILIQVEQKMSKK